MSLAAPTFRPDIEGLRGIAVLLVVLYHAGVPGVSGGFVGVDVFFVLSGYLITGAVVRELERTGGRIDLVEFYARRYRRLSPALGVIGVVVIAACFAIVGPVEYGHRLWRLGVAAALYLSNLLYLRIRLDYLGDHAPDPFLHTWSLSVEEQFYLFWPLLLWLFWKAGTRTGRPRAGLVLGLAATALGGLVWAERTADAQQPLAFFGTHMRAWEFAAGALAFALQGKASRGTPSLRAAAEVLGMGALVLLLVCAAHYDKTTRFPGLAALPPVLATAVALKLGEAERRTFAGCLLQSRLLRWAGRISYSWYLWHWPVLVLAELWAGEPLPLALRLLLVVLSAGLAELSLRYVENPLRFSPRLVASPWRSLRLSAAIALAGAGVCAALLLLSQALMTPERAAFRNVLLEAKDVVERECMVDQFSTGFRDCQGGDAASPRRLVVFGDSKAGHWVEVADSLGRADRWRTHALVRQSCSPFAVTVEAEHLRRPLWECDAWRGKALERIEALRPEVVLVSSFTYPVRMSLSGAAWARGIDSTLTRLKQTGARVIVLEDVPRLSGSVPQCISRAEWQGRSCRVRRESTAAWEAHAQTVRHIAGQHGMPVLGPVRRLCSETHCTLMPFGAMLYRDAHHLTRPLALRFLPEVQQAVRVHTVGQPPQPSTRSPFTPSSAPLPSRSGTTSTMPGVASRPKRAASS